MMVSRGHSELNCILIITFADYLLHPGKGPERCSWEVLIRHMSVLLLRSMSILPL